MTETLRFTAPLEEYFIEEGFDPMGWITLTGDIADSIAAHELMRRLEIGKRRGFGSVKVAVRVGNHHWRTSVFPHKSGGWFLPIKKPVRIAEKLNFGDAVEVELELL